MSEVRNSDDLSRAITRLLQQQIDDATDAVIKEAVDKFEQELRLRVATTAMQVSTFYELSANRNGVNISVKFNGSND